MIFGLAQGSCLRFAAGFPPTVGRTTACSGHCPRPGRAAAASLHGRPSPPTAHRSSPISPPHTVPAGPDRPRRSAATRACGRIACAPVSARDCYIGLHEYTCLLTSDDARTCRGPYGSCVAAPALPIFASMRIRGAAMRGAQICQYWMGQPAPYPAPRCRTALPGSWPSLPPAGCRPAGVGVGGRDARFAPGRHALIAEPRFAPLVAPRVRVLFDIIRLSCIDRQWLLDHLSVMHEVTTSGPEHADYPSGLRIREFASMTNQSLRCAKPGEPS